MKSIALLLTVAYGSAPPASTEPTPMPDPFALEASDPFALDQPTTPAPSPAPTQSPAQPVESTAPVSAPAPIPAPAPAPLPPPRDGGVGDRVAGGVMSLVGVALLGGAIALQAVHAHRIDRCFRSVLDHNFGWSYEELGQCERNERGWRWGARVLLVGSPIFSLTGGAALGRGRAAADAVERQPARGTGAMSGLGGMLIAVGAMGVVATNTAFLVDDVKNRCAHLGFERCARYNHLMLSGFTDLSVLAMSAGALMVGYGSGYRRTARRYGVTLVPSVGLGYVGLGLVGEFGRP